ncbi:hypothetical protein ACH4VT_16955 [Streptomyces lydicus]|uniref:hypothetical protein n=1 Tax=Streptomyces lydicus TaxID=47763 RepID=UPI003792EE50
MPAGIEPRGPAPLGDAPGGPAARDDDPDGADGVATVRRLRLQRLLRGDPVCQVGVVSGGVTCHAPSGGPPAG